MLKKLPFYPLLFSIFPVVSLAAYNIDQISLDVIIRPLFVSLFIGAILLGLMGLIFRDWDRAALAALLIMALFFSYGQIYNLLEDVTLGKLSIFRHRTLLPLFGIALAILLFFVARRFTQSKGLTIGLNILSLFLLIYPVSKITLDVFQQWSADGTVHASYREVVPKTNQPDIYYIILDSYGREDILRDLFGYDNKDFLNSLRQRGFYIADCSQSNYAYTEFSLASSLNYDYLDRLNVSHSRADRIALLKHSATRSFLEANGYEIVAFPTGWAFTEWKDADLYLDVEHAVTSLTEFESLVLDTTAMRAFSDLRSSKRVDASHKDLRRLRIFSLLDNIKKLPERNGNFFVFAHMVVPHLPYTFGPNGEVPAFEGKNASYQETATAYVDQVRFVNEEVLDVIDILIRNSKVPPIIILQGDHGPLPDLVVDSTERLSILNAYYLPGIEVDRTLYPSISPVNSFRVVLNSYFGQNLPLLDDQSYFGPPDGRDEYQRVPNTCPGNE